MPNYQFINIYLPDSSVTERVIDMLKHTYNVELVEDDYRFTLNIPFTIGHFDMRVKILVVFHIVYHPSNIEYIDGNKFTGNWSEDVIEMTRQFVDILGRRLNLEFLPSSKN